MLGPGMLMAELMSCMLYGRSITVAVFAPTVAVVTVLLPCVMVTVAISSEVFETTTA